MGIVERLTMKWAKTALAWTWAHPNRTARRAESHMLGWVRPTAGFAGGKQKKKQNSLTDKDDG